MSDFNKWIFLKEQQSYIFVTNIENEKYDFPYSHWEKTPTEFYFSSYGSGDPEDFDQRNSGGNREVDPKLTLAEKQCMIANLLGDEKRKIEY